jgi:hypothetical protein
MCGSQCLSPPALPPFLECGGSPPLLRCKPSPDVTMNRRPCAGPAPKAFHNFGTLSVVPNSRKAAASRRNPKKTSHHQVVSNTNPKSLSSGGRSSRDLRRRVRPAFCFRPRSHKCGPPRNANPGSRAHSSERPTAVSLRHPVSRPRPHPRPWAFQSSRWSPR